VKGIVVYYSGSGSTKKIAKAIHRGMQDGLEQCDIASVKEANPKDMAAYDIIAIGSPIWYYREVACVRLFIQNMPDMKGKLAIPFCTHGSAPWGFMLSIVPALKRKGLTITGWGDWYGSVHYVLHMPTPYFTDGHPDEIDVKEAEQFGRDMIDRAKHIQAGENDLIPKEPKRTDTETLWQTSQQMLKHMDELQQGIIHTPNRQPPGGKSPPPPQRNINMQKCLYPRCTACIDNCPSKAIDFSESPPVVKKNCTQCNLCVRLCTVEAIEVEGGQRRGQKTIDVTKCTYPECTLCIDHCAMNSIDFSVNPPVFKNNCEGDDLCWVICPHDAIKLPDVASTHGRMVVDRNHEFLPLLAEAEAKGKFRRLVSLDEVGWDNPIWKITKAPRYVIEED